MNISMPTPGTFQRHQAPQEVLDTLKLMMTEAEAQVSQNTLLATNVLKFFNVLAPLHGSNQLKEIFFEVS